MSTQNAEEKGYNGSTNYETWLVNLWLTNDEGTYNYWREKAVGAREESKNDPGVCGIKREARGFLADYMKDSYEEEVSEVLSKSDLSDWSTVGMFTDLLNAALSEVDWYEIADHFLED